TWLRDQAASLAHRRDLLTAGLHAAGLTTATPQGAYFVMADAAPLLTGRIAGRDIGTGADLCRALPDLAGVVAVPATAFTTPGSGRPPPPRAAPPGRRRTSPSPRGCGSRSSSPRRRSPQRSPAWAGSAPSSDPEQGARQQVRDGHHRPEPQEPAHHGHGRQQP